MRASSVRGPLCASAQRLGADAPHSVRSHAARRIGRTVGRRCSPEARRRSSVVLPCAASAAPSSQQAPPSPNAGASASPPTLIKLQLTPLTPENFAPFGQVVGTGEDGKAFDHEDAQLVLDKGTPRFYIMRLPSRGLKFHRITYHAQVTQCLGGLYPVQDWYMAVSKPSGSLQNYPKPEDIRVFRVPHGTYLKMEVGTWHAGPLFAGSPTMDFYNLELKDTNVVDHNTHDYSVRLHNLVQMCALSHTCAAAWTEGRAGLRSEETSASAALCVAG